MSNRAGNQPYVVKLAPGDYYWCACGRSRRPPYCDGSHRGTLCSPVKVEQRQTGDVRLCGCQRSATKPYCDCAQPDASTRSR